MMPNVREIKTGRPYLVDLPVSVMIWTRPELQRMQFDVIAQARPSVLFLISDGGRNERERELINQSRSVFNEIDWNCTVHEIFFDSNQGMYSINKQVSPYKWGQADRMVLLEDDIIPSVDYFRFCAEMLDKYENDLRILGVCGMNHEGVSELVDGDYLFSREASIWGMAIWRRTIENRNFDYSNNEYALKAITEASRLNPDFQKRLVGYANSEVYEGHVAAGEFWYAFDVFAQNQLYIVPKKNLISNRGCSAASAHADDLKLLPKGIQRVFNMETYSLCFPLKHPAFVTPDIRYQKAVYRIMGVGHPMITLHRKLSRALRIFVFKGPKSLLSKAISVNNRNEQ